MPADSRNGSHTSGSEREGGRKREGGREGGRGRDGGRERKREGGWKREEEGGKEGGEIEAEQVRGRKVCKFPRDHVYSGPTKF